MILWPEALLSALARRRAVIVIGAGVSKHSTSAKGGERPPLWGEFLEEAMKKAPVQDRLKPIQEALKVNDLLHACEWLKQRYDEHWIEYIRSIFQRPQYTSAPIHDLIFRLDSRIVFSLNFDDIYERHANTIGNGAFIVKNYFDPDVSEFLRGDSRYIIKVHGSLNRPDDTIFTQADYASARIKHGTFYKAFDAALLTNTFLFIGCGYSDPDVNLLLENQNFNYPSSLPHYFLSGSEIGEDRKLSLRKNRNIKVIEYDPVDDLHTGILYELEALIEQVEARRFDLAGNASW